MEQVPVDLDAVSDTLEELLQCQKSEREKKDILDRLQSARTNAIMIAGLEEQLDTKENEEADLATEIQEISSRLKKLKDEAREEPSSDQLKEELEDINNREKALKTLKRKVDEAAKMAVINAQKHKVQQNQDDQPFAQAMGRQ